MRFLTISILLGSCLLILSSGCQKASIQCQRETALLRAEILDLEDKYYALKSQHERQFSGTSGAYVTNNVIGSGVIEGAPVVVNSWPADGQVVSGDVIYEDQIIGGTPMLQAPVEGGVYYEGQAYGGQTYDGQMLPMATPVYGSGVEAAPTLAAPYNDMEGSAPTNGEVNDSIEMNDVDDQSLLLPDASSQRDTPALEVGFEDLELDLSSDVEVDRIEIVSSGTRGKDLDGIDGHDGIEVMIQAINSNGETVDETGELTVTVSDNLVGEIGKWTFLSKELQLFQSRDELGNMGTLLHLPWTDRIPVSKLVEVRVSMMIGRIQYVATQQVKIKPPTGQAGNNAVAGWTANEDRWDKFQFKSRPASNPSSTAVQRPQWKPVR